METSLAGKVALVTGAASGIGAACALDLARQGARVVVADWNADLGEQTAAALKEKGTEALFVQVDVSRPESVEKMVAETLKAFGRLDAAVNNAGISGESNSTGSYSIEGWQKVIDVNLNGVFYCMRHEIPPMLAQGGGAIVNMGSILSTVGFATAPAYVAAKHGVVGLTKAAALEYAQQGIRINAVGPGFIKTPLLSQLDEEAEAQIAGRHAMGRMGDAQEVAELVTFLCSQQASFVTGGYYLVDGGYTAQ